MKFTRLILFLGFITILFQACDEDEGYVCTDEFVTYSVTVLNPNGEPTDSVQVSTTDPETGEKFPVCEVGPCKRETGTYVIMHDGLREQISETLETVLVKGSKGNMQFEEGFAFRAGKCHVEKISGPDTVSLSRKN